MKLPHLSAHFSAVAVLFLSAAQALAFVVTEPLELTSNFIPALTFSETHTDKVVKTIDPLDHTNITYSVEASLSTSASVTANITGTVLSSIDGTTPFALNIGGAQIGFNLGDIPTYQKGQTTAFFCWNGWSPAPANKPLGTGGVKLTWTATKLTVTVTMGNETTRPTPIGTEAFVGVGTTPGTFAIKDSLTADITFGGISTTVPRNVYVTGSYTVTHVLSGPADNPTYEFDLYTVTESGAANYTRPTVALTSPKQGASVGASVDVSGTASDAKGLSGVEWTTDLNGAWAATDQFSLSTYPSDGLWGTTSAIWTVSLTSLPHGTNSLWVRSIDDSGNTSVPLLITLVYPMPIFLSGRWDTLLVPDAVNGLRGAINFTFASNGSFTGTLVQEGGSYPFSGFLTANETLNVSIGRGTLLAPVNLLGSIATFSPTGLGTAVITGHLEVAGSSVATFSAYRSPWSATNLADPTWAGSFHVQVAASAPLGNSYAVVTTARSGTASAAFVLADGSSVTWSGVMGASGQLPAFGLLYGGKGSVSVPMVVDGGSRSIDPTSVIWVRPPAFTDKQFPAGFALNLAASGSAYTAPSPASTRVMGLAAGTLNATASWNGDGVTPGLSQTFTVNAGNTLTMPVNANALQLSLAASTGLWTGSFKIPTTTVLSACKLLIVDKEAYGYWVAPAPTGSVVKRFGVVHVK